MCKVHLPDKAPFTVSGISVVILRGKTAPLFGQPTVLEWVLLYARFLDESTKAKKKNKTVIPCSRSPS